MGGLGWFVEVLGEVCSGLGWFAVVCGNSMVPCREQTFVPPAQGGST